MIPEFVSLYVAWTDRANAAERIDVLFGVQTPGNPRNAVIDRVPPPTARGEVMGFDATFAKLL